MIHSDNTRTFFGVLQVLHAVQVAESEEKPQIKELFTDVYDVPPSNLREQEMSLRQVNQKTFSRLSL